MPLLVLFLDLPERVATATSLGAIGITALAGVVVFGVRGDIDVGYAALVGIPATAGALDERFEEWVRADPDWEVVAPRPFSVVCFRLRGSDGENERLLERMNATGEIFISHMRLADRYVLRLAVGSFHTTEDDVRLAWDVLRREAAAL